MRVARVRRRSALSQAKKKKNFGGKGGPSGNLNKGIKNAKRAAAPH